MDDVRSLRIERLTGSGSFTKRPCLVYSLCGIGVADSTNVYTIHDGFGTNDRVIMRLVSIAYTPDFRPFYIPLYFAKGLYVDFTTNGVEVFAQYLEIDSVKSVSD